jgi:hypothetical protein
MLDRWIDRESKLDSQRYAKSMYSVVHMEMEKWFPQHIARNRETSSYGEREPMSCTVKAEELHRS